MWSNADRDYRFLYKLKTIFFSSNYGTQLCMKVSLWRVFSHSCKGIACATRPMLEEARKLSLGIILKITHIIRTGKNKQKTGCTFPWCWILQQVKKYLKEKKRKKSRKIWVWTRLTWFEPGSLAARRLHYTTELLTKVAEIYLYITLPLVWQTHWLIPPPLK